jgi:biopolymer transport protein ExbD
VNGQLLKSDEDLLPMARLEHQAHPEVRAVVQADGKVLHERVVHAIDLLSQAGITQIAFGVTLTLASTPPAGPSGQ